MAPAEMIVDTGFAFCFEIGEASHLARKVKKVKARVFNHLFLKWLDVVCGVLDHGCIYYCFGA